MAASEAAVTAAQAKAGCWFEETVAGLFCNAHHCYADQRHETRSECDVIASIADAAVDADRASIQAETAKSVTVALADLIEPFSGIGMANGATRADVARWLRDRADRIEAQP